MTPARFDTDVVVIGSGFGGSVAALRFAQAGQRVVVVERGDWVSRDKAGAGLDWFWRPERNRFGTNDIQPRGERVVPWLGSGVGGGSHVFAGTLKRCSDFSSYPAAVREDDMTPYYEVAERMMGVAPYPEHAPYGACRATRLLLDAGAALAQREPELVVDHGVVPLAVSFAPESDGDAEGDGDGAQPGDAFVNEHGAAQRYFDPGEQALLGGDIDAKNTLDKNYLHRAQSLGVDIRALSEVERIEPLPGGGYRVHIKRWMPGQEREESQSAHQTLTARRVVVAAGAIGTTELLLRSRDVHRTLPGLGRALGRRYTTNGNYLNLIVPFRGAFVAWLGFAVLLVGLVAKLWWLAGLGALAYYAQLWLSRPAHDPDLGTTNSDMICFRGQERGPEDGARDHVAYIESGRYPTPMRLFMAALLSALGVYRPRRYRGIVRVSRAVAMLVPPFGALARTWPIPLLQMGRDQAVGTMRLHPGKDGDPRLVIDYDVAANRAHYAYLDELGKKVARAARALWLPNVPFWLTGRLEVPHNQGGAPMGESAEDGVVDHAGRVFGHPGLMVLDGSIMPASPGPNPALTILALSERAMGIACAQLAGEGEIRADEPRTLHQPAAARRAA